uniref:Uncharacterized protein n=1 Tax=Tanacetum cinerariifolium TaxID=118510 RepID=A0A6L2LC08_TANCI|nr:hypothetical protein [Tanacetum cinerariifolium]
MLEEKFRDLCEEVSNFVKEIKDVIKEVERLSCKDVANESVCLLRRAQKRELYMMTRLQMMADESHLSVREKHAFVRVTLPIVSNPETFSTQNTFKKNPNKQKIAYFPRLDELTVAANSRGLFEGMLVYCDRENARDLEFANGLDNLWVNEIKMLSSELNLFGGPLAVQCAEYLKQSSKSEVLRMLELRKTIAKVHIQDGSWIFLA